MIVLSHRGYWLKKEEKNNRIAFERSFHLGFGIETDVRDFNGQLVISHDPVQSNCMELEELFELYIRYKTRPILAFNIKADGLQAALQQLLTSFGIQNYFVFDMSVPDSLLYISRGMPTYTRHSEYEPVPPYYALASGVWLDEFNGHWFSDDTVEKHLNAGKVVCLVSPELHKRPYDKEWMHYKKIEKITGENSLMLCTDLPEQAQEFFNA